MVNFGLNSAAILGIFLAVAGAGLYFLRSIRPELARDQDIFFAAVGLLCGGILLTQGWRLDPILQFGQFLLTGSTVFFAFEAIRLRGLATEQAKRRTPIVDEERPVSKAYRYDQEAELYDQLEPEEERYVSPRLRGTADPRTSPRDRDRYEGEVRRSRSRNTPERSGSDERPPKRRPRPSNRPAERPADTWNADVESDWEEKPARSSRPRPSRTESYNSRDSRAESYDRPESYDSEVVTKPRRRRPPQEPSVSSPKTRGEEAPPSDYVDYQPIDPEDEQSNQPERFDY
ncbi:MAG TPA: Ycf66 family protein [Coleofasciculaceae cyanobacterium]